MMALIPAQVDTGSVDFLSGIGTFIHTT